MNKCFMFIHNLFCPDMPYQADWALKTSYLLILYPHMFNLVADICPYTSVYDPISEKTYVVMDTELGETYNSPEICLSSKSFRSKHVGSDSHPGRICWETLTRSGRMIPAHWRAFERDPFGQNLAQSARTKSDPG